VAASPSPPRVRVLPRRRGWGRGGEDDGGREEREGGMVVKGGLWIFETTETSLIN
jgi:hypothetical protein